MKPSSLFFVHLALLVLLTSCINDAREIDHRSMIVGMAIDLEKSDNTETLYNVTLQIPILLTGGQEATSSGSVSEFETFSAKGKTILDAITQIEAMTPTVLFFGHLKVVTLSEEVSRDGIDRVIDFFDRLPQVANQIFLLIIEGGSAQEFISTESPLVSLPSLYLNRFFQADQKISRTNDVKLFEYRRDSNMISGAATLPLGHINGEGKINIQGMAVIKDHKLVSKLVNYEVGLSELLKNNYVDNVNYTTKIDTNVGSEEIAISRGKLTSRISFEKKKPLTVNIIIKGKGEITEVGTPEIKITNQLVKKVNEKVAKEIETILNNTINKMKEDNVEPWLIGHRLWAMDPNFFDTLNWEQTGWRDAVVNVTVDFTTEHTGQKGYLSKRKIGR